jgi:serine/threonine protein kinase/tetratricopeptide (TPR) repeat protein
VTSEVSAHDPLIDHPLGHYRILERIGSGGMGVVYRAHDEHLNREVAIKVLPLGTLADEAARRRFRNEALTLSKLNHPNIATIHDFDTQRGLDFLVMEYIPGVTLNDKLAEGSLPEKQVITLGTQLAEGLSAAHEHAVIHRDLKPGNLRLSADGRLKILDFGLAKLRTSAVASPATETVSETHALAGTLPYMAPEQLFGGEIDARTDLHAAGAVLYEMATGQRAFPAAERLQLAAAILRSAPRPAGSLNPRLSPELSRIIGKCLEREPEARYQSAKELAIDLRRLQSGALSGVQPAATVAARPSSKAVRLALLVFASVIVVLLAFNVGNWRKRTLSRPDAPHIESLAVLPLVNLSGDPQQEYFADGMTEELITSLGKVAPLRVISRTSVMQYKQTRKPLPTIATELNVDAVVEGSVMRSGNRVRITAQLIEARADRHLWAETYERDASDVLALQSDVAQAIAGQIQAKLTPLEHQLLTSAKSVNPAAHEAYLRGRYHWSQMTEEELKKARAYFEQAIEIDPNYAPPYAGLADYYAESYELPFQIGLQKARQYAEKALSLDETLAEAHLSLGNIQYHEWNWQEAQREFQRTLELNPSNAEAHRRYSFYLSALGRRQESWGEIQSAQELDPLSVSVAASMGWVAYFARDYDLAIMQCKKVLNINPKNVDGYECLGLSYLAKGMYDQAVAACLKATTLSEADPDRMVCLGQAYAASGKTVEARRLLQELSQTSKRRNVPPYFFALLHAGLDEKDEAFVCLEESYRERDPYLVWLKVSPAADALRTDSRFDQLVRKVGPGP